MNGLSGLPANAGLFLAAASALLVVFIMFGVYRFRIRPNRLGLSDPRYRRKMEIYAATLTEFLSGLWSADTDARMTALLVAKRLSENPKEASGLEGVLVAFIRHRLSSEQRSRAPKEIFEDVRMALDLLVSPRLRNARDGQSGRIDLSAVDFRGVPLAGADLKTMNLAQSGFDGGNLAGARMEGADLTEASFKGADLTGAHLGGAIAVGADFARAGFGGCDLSRADLSGADLSDADFSGARVGRASFQDADISGAILIKAGGLTQKQLDDAFGDSNTSVPDTLRFVSSRARNRVPAMEPAAQ